MLNEVWILEKKNKIAHSHCFNWLFSTEHQSRYGNTKRGEFAILMEWPLILIWLEKTNITVLVGCYVRQPLNFTTSLYVFILYLVTRFVCIIASSYVIPTPLISHTSLYITNQKYAGHVTWVVQKVYVTWI